MPLVLAIDDDPLTLKCYQYAMADLDVEINTAGSLKEGKRLVAERHPNVILCDLQLPDGTGMELLGEIRKSNAKVPFILVTGHGNAEVAIEAMGKSVFDYLVKPVDPDRLANIVKQALETDRLMRVPAVMPRQENLTTSSDVLIGECAAMQEVYKAIGRVAPQDVMVLIRGESGTGKEMVARAIYHYSKRSHAPFLAINCAAIPESLLESELFGHEKGAFTGADRKRIGKFEQCSGGTLFLDEIGDMAPLMQTKILRVLQDQRFERVGGNETIQTDVRLIAATNRNLEEAVASGQFRSDLFYRLNVFAIPLPPLRERKGDIPLLVQQLIGRFSKELGKEVQSVSEPAMEQLESYSWPGNIRELQSTIKHALLCMVGTILLPEHLPDQVQGRGGASKLATHNPNCDIDELIKSKLRAGGENLYQSVICDVEKRLLREVLKQTCGNQSHAAVILGISRPTLRAKLAHLGLAIERNIELEETSAS